MDIIEEVFWVQKAGSSSSEYEDAFCPNVSIQETGDHFRFAIADGATESSFAGLWARILVASFVSSRNNGVRSILDAGRQQWAREVGGRTLPWYAAAKLEKGAFSSFLGLTLCSRQELEYVVWTAEAVGDSCLFQVRNDRVLVRFPLESAVEFGSSPFLLSSVGEDDDVGGHVRRASGDCHEGDTFYLMTDALACWFMTEEEAGRFPWYIFRDLKTESQIETFSELIERLRKEGVLKNDDTTLMRIEIRF